MNTSSLVIFDDVKQSPQIRVELPTPTHIGTRIKLSCNIRRVNKGRTEEFHADGEFKVTSVMVDTSKGTSRQIVTVCSSKAVSPTWVAVKNQPPRKLAPARQAPTKVV